MNAYSPPAKQDDRADMIVRASLQEFSQLKSGRSTFEEHWNECAELILPSYANTFSYGAENSPGQKKTQRQVDATGSVALSRFAAICDSLSTPRNMRWHGLEASDPYVMKDRQVKLWFEQVTDILFRYRYSPHANFTSQNQQVFQSLGAFGTGALFIDEFDGTLYGNTRGIRYKAMHIGAVYLRQNHQGLIDGFCRVIPMTAQQMWDRWGPHASNTFPASLMPALESKSQREFYVIHRVCPRTDYDPERLDYRGKPFASYYISMESQALLQEGGYMSFPMALPRYDMAPNETYGRGPAMQVLPSLKTLNAEKTTFLKQGHRAADPVLLVADDGLLNMSMRPGAMNVGGMSADGKPLVGILPTGEIQISKEMMQEEKSLINDVFLVTLFQILTETPTMTATEVMERVNEKGILLAPTVGRQQSDYIGPMIDREIDLLARQRLLPPMPPLLREAGGEYQVIHTSPLARAARAQEVTGFFRTVEFVKEIVNITQDPSPLDNLDFDTAIPEIAEIQGVPVRWLASEQQLSVRRRGRAQQAAAQQQIQAAPAAAAMLKARVAAAESGVKPQDVQGA